MSARASVENKDTAGALAWLSRLADGGSDLVPTADRFPGIGDRPAFARIVEVTTRDGRRLARRVDHARGSPERPLRPDEIREKFRGLAGSVASAARTEAIAALVDRVERLPGLARLAALLRAPAPTGRAGRRGTPASA